MDTVKNVIAVIVSIIGAVTALLTAYAKYLDVKKQAAKDRAEAAKDRAEAAAMSPARPHEGQAQIAAPVPPPLAEPPPTTYLPAGPDVAAIGRAREAVRAPATTMIGLGALSLFFYLLVAVVGVIQGSGALNPPRANVVDPGFGRQDRTAQGLDGTNDRETVLYGALGSLYFMVASVVAIWAGIGMIRLRGYWFSVAGSFAIMMGSGCCLFFVGVPVGIWSLMVLFRPEVASSFE